MAILTAQQVSLAGAAPTTQAAAVGGDKVVPGDNVWVEVTNGGGAPITVTIDSKVASNYGTDVDAGGSVPAGASRRFGPLNPTRFMGSDGMADIAYSGVTSVTVAAWKV